MTLMGHEVRADELWVIAIAALCGVSCGTLGCFLVLRRLSLLGDAISHAVLPGLAIAFLVVGTRDLVPMLVGAAATGLLTAVGSAALHRWGRVPEDAAMGVTFSTLFAIGVILVTWVANSVDLDPGCVLYGLIEFAPFDTVRIVGLSMPRSFVGLAVITTVDVALVLLFWKELKLVAFDPALATAMGFRAAAVHYSLMGLVAATTVASFESVGSILVVAMLIAPGATAHLCTDRLGRMVWIAAIVSIVAAIVGFALAVYWNTSVAGMVSVVLLGEFLLAALAAPRHGVVSRFAHRAILSLRIAREDALGLLWRWREHQGTAPMPRESVLAALGGGALPRVALTTLRASGEIVGAPNGFSLSDMGVRAGQGVVRAHRLWEGYLSKRLGLAEDHLHEPAHRVEHFVGESLGRRIAEDLAADDASTTDPHGREIPPEHRDS